MGVRQGKWKRKATRYQFGQNENHPVRFKSRKTHRILTSKIFDISVSGLSFITTTRLAPHVGELINMEFAPMGAMQIACVGLVVRIEIPSEESEWSRFPEMVKVGISFHDLPRRYGEILAKSLDYVFQAQTVRKKERSLRVAAPRKWQKPWILDNALNILFSVLLIVGTVYGIYYISENVDTFSQPDARWAQGFFQKIIPPNKR